MQVLQYVVSFVYCPSISPFLKVNLSDIYETATLTSDYAFLHPLGMFSLTESMLIYWVCYRKRTIRFRGAPYRVCSLKTRND